MLAEDGKIKIGILDIHGSVKEHADCLKKLGVEVSYVKLPKDLENISGLIIPGGESTTMSKLLKKFELDKAIKDFAAKGFAIWGSCAGAILLGNCSDSKVDSLSLINANIERNAYGRQLDSFESPIEFNGGEIPGIFIRAPKISKLDSETTELAKHNGETVAARKNKIIVSAFHPELSSNLEFHKYFVSYC